jgi:hypothetical protein
LEEHGVEGWHVGGGVKQRQCPADSLAEDTLDVWDAGTLEDADADVDKMADKLIAWCRIQRGTLRRCGSGLILKDCPEDCVASWGEPTVLKVQHGYLHQAGYCNVLWSAVRIVCVDVLEMVADALLALDEENAGQEVIGACPHASAAADVWRGEDLKNSPVHLLLCTRVLCNMLEVPARWKQCMAG